MSKLRSSLGGAWEQPRSSLEYAYSMLMTTFLRPFSCKRAELERRLASDEITARPSRDYGSSLTRLRLTISLLLMFTLGSGSVWGQTNYSGTYFMAMPGTGSYDSETIENNYYLVPTEGWCYFVTPNSVQAEDNGQPFLTTYKCGHVKKAKWIIQKHTTENKYYIIHLADGKYLTYNVQLSGAGENRVRVHLEASITGDNNLFTITKSGNNYFISPETGQYLNVTDGNKNSYAGASGKNDGPTGYKDVSGIIGRWNQNNNTSQFRLEPTSSIDAPTITDNNDGTFTIAAASGATIYYTTDGSIPTTTSYTGTGTTSVNIDQTESMTVIKAIAKAASDAVPTDVTTFNLPACETPIITFDYTTSNVSITCATPNSNIYYTTDGSTPTSSSTLYSAPFSVSSSTTVKAIATKSGIISSAVAELAITQVATPTIQNNGSNAISITSTTPGATFYYTTDGTDPTTSSAVYNSPLTDNVSNVTIKAIAVKENMIPSAVGSGSVKLKCATPVITRDGMTFTLSCSMPTDANLYYTLGGGSETSYSGPVAFTADQLPITVTAVARHSDYNESEEASFELNSGSGTPEDPYLIYGSTDFFNFVTNVNNGTTASASYKLGSDVSASGADAITTAFTGTFDGGGYTISNLGHPLFNTVDGGVIKNVILDAVSISGGANTGAIANKVTGTSAKMGSVYSCGVLSGNVSGSGYVGSIVGQLGDSDADNCYARVINCFSYATVSGGSDSGGIVGYNSFASTAANIRTMVMNCMYYGDITGGTNVSPVYGGEIINNLQGGLSNFNYYAYTKLTTATINKYNNALSIEDKFLNRFEYYRLLLNSNKRLAAFYATGSHDNANQKMLKWVLETADRTIDNPKPYPILKTQGYYPSIINPDFKNAPDSASVGRNHGGKLGSKTLLVTINSVGSNAPSGANITTGSLTLTRTDKDFDRFNFNYDKVQLPYYNDVGTGNYTESKVVTGWKITAITAIDGDPYTSANYPTTGITDFPNHNYADRKSSNKDLYSVSGRVFSQGAYFDVPYGVTSITIEPYWGQAAYIADPNYDVVYYNTNNTDYNAKQNVTQTGTQVGNGAKFNSQTIYTSISDNLLNTFTGQSVYDNAIVLVGNLHLSGVPSGGDKPFTMMSVDEDNDHEPDYSLIYHHKGRTAICPIRFDFLNIPGTAQAQKPNGASLICNFTIFKTKGWFEVTNTSSFYTSQLEYENQASLTKSDAPLILLGGVIDQFVSTQSSSVDGHTIYIHLGSNVWINEFGMGTHSDGSQSTPHVPVSVTGGEFPGFYLTGTYKADATVRNDNAECYISGGYIHEAAGASLEQIGGNVRWQIYDADIENFFGGGINDAKPIKGDITTDIYNSHVTLFCGGPKFGNMQTGKKVSTNAEGCTFGKYFGAGYGGLSYSKKKYYDKDDDPVNWTTQQSYYTNDRGKYYDGKTTELKQGATSYGFKGPGVATDFDYEYFVWTSGKTGGRFYVKFASFSLAQCNDVSSTLKKCTIENNFYGGGNLGKVVGTATSILEDCTVKGNVYGAGYSASIPTVEVRDAGFTKNPNYNSQSGMFEPGVFSGTTTFTWQNATAAGKTLTNGQSGSDLTNHILYTDIELTGLGEVAKTVLTINGTTTVGESVYGGGEESGVGGDTEVNVTGGTIGTTDMGGATWGNVFGGGKGKEDDVNAGLVKGNTNITISGTADATKIIHNVYGGGAFGSVGTFTYDGTTGLPNGLTANTGTANITITGGTFGSDGKENGMIFGSSRGSEGDPESDDYVDKIAWVGNTNVVIGTQNAESNANPWIKGSVYGGGENGHNYQDGHVTVHSGTIGITDSSVDGGARYSTRGNVYGGGCGTDTFDRGEGDNKKTYYNFNAGIVLGNTTIDIDGGHIVHNVYGGGAMGSVGTFTFADDAYHAEHTDVPVGMPYECKTGTGNCTINITGGLFGMTNATMTGHGNDGPDDFGHVFGAGRGYSKDPNVYPNIESCAFFNNTQLTISGKALVCGSVYGGSESGHVLNNTNVTISGGQIGCGEGRTAAYTDSDFNSASLPGTAHWTNDANGAPYDQYADAQGKYPDGSSSEGGKPIATDGRTFYGNVFAGGSGYYPYAPGKWLKSAGHIRGTATVTVSGGHILNNLYGGCEMADIDGAVTVTMTGGTVGVPRTKEDITANPNYGNVYGAGMGDKRIFFNTSTNVASATVNISNGTIYGAVYGGGEDGHVMGNVTTTISQPAEKTTVIGCDGQSGYDGNVFGAGQGHTGALTAGVVGGNASLSITGGLMKGSVYGGGRIASVGTYFAMATDPRYGKMQDGDDHGCLTVSLTGGTIEQNVYGGCMGTTANVLYGESKNVLVELNKDKTATDRGCAVKGDIFGCNNVNGTPQGDVEVHIYATQNAAATQIANTPAVAASETTPAVAAVEDAKVKYRYDVRAVYGGGNLAVYNPATPYDGTLGSKTKVIIEGCALTSIETVYGGGNAAAVPETDVYIKSAYEIGYLFGGGNGKDDIAPGVPNPGADVGTPDHGTSIYGRGNANTLMEGGLIHEAYGGSNTKGIIKGSINQITDPKDPAVEPDCCVLEVEKIVGAGKYADIDGDVNMTLSCQPDRKVNLLFAGADEANVNGNITLNITNGHFGKVFGGNNLGGAIKGKITVKVEETGCQPIKIDDLYLGGNEAAYSVFGYYESDEDHPVTGKKILKPRTSADDTHLPVKYDGTPYASISDFTNYAQPELNIISCTYIGNVFGGGFGKGAVMYANPTVNVNMVPGLYAETAVPAMMTDLGLDVTKTAPNPDNLGIIRNVYGGGDAANIAGDTYVNIATEANKGAYIIGSVFGGGNAADVLGNTNVTVSGGYVFNGIFGGGFAGSVGTFTRSTAPADVTIYGHTAHEGCIGKPVSCAEGTGKCTVVVDGGQIGPLSVATQGMNRSKDDGGPVPEGWVWGAGQGLVEDPATHPDTHFTSYVGSTDVTIGGTALIMESIIGGGEFGRVFGNTLVKIEGGQIGIGAGKVDGDNKPIRYTDDQFVNPLTTTITSSYALAECSHYPYGRNTGTTENPNWVYLPYDPYCEKYPDYYAAHPEFAPASTSNPSDGKTWIGCVFAGGSGYMPYEKKDGTGYDWCPSAGLVEGDAEVRISGGHILTNVYGGNEITDVKGTSKVKMTGGTIGVPRTLEQIVKHPLTCYLFGAGKGDERSRFYNYTNTGSVEVEISGGIIYGSVFGGSEDGHVTGDIDLTIRKGDDFTIGSTTYTNGPIIGTWGTSYVDGNVFGGGRGFSGNTLTAGNVGGNVTMNISGGNILGSVYGGGRLASVGTYLVETTDGNYGKQIPDNGNEKHGHITINISGGTIGNDKEYIYNPTDAQKAAMPNTTFDYQNHLQYTKGGNVFTAGMGRLYALDNKTVLSQWQKLGQCKQTVLNMTGGTVKSSVYGGGEIGIVAQNATLNIKGGTVGTKVVDSGDAAKYYYFGSVFGGGKGSTENIDGISAAGTTQGDVEVHLNKDLTDDKTGAVVHQVFGCNDMNGSPKGTVTVHVYATQNADKENISTKYDKNTETFDVEAVYGGGNLAAYEPTNLETGKAKVIIDGCGLTSVRQVYGGGNAASTPATDVEINGTYEILELFGGGNGADKLPNGDDNPGANVGYKDYHLVENDPAYATKEARTEGDAFAPYRYGTGEATVNIKGGTIHRVFGGSNTKGNVRKTALTMLEEVTDAGVPKCEFHVDEAYGGGKSAPMDAEAKLLMACIPGLNEVYGGAEAADIHDDVSLTITNGNFNRVFGGNNISGTISGKITVNVEETGCRPVIIGELYGGGNLAAYSKYGYNDDGTPKESGENPSDDPVVNVRSFTSIGAVYGGGYGTGARMIADPTVNINESVGTPDNYPTTGDYDTNGFKGKTIKFDEGLPTEHTVTLPAHTKGKMGAIGDVFGGGNAAQVMGNTTVNIGTLSDNTFVSLDDNPATTETDESKKPVLGVDIRGNVYGGGNNAAVTGNTNVNIGKRAE